MNIVLDTIMESVPPVLKKEAESLKDQITVFVDKVTKIQEECSHNWKKIMGYDKDYSPRLDGRGVGQQVLKELVCLSCNLHKPFKAFPFRRCHKCGGKMKHDRREQFGMDTAHINKCEDCGHEYDTT